MKSFSGLIFRFIILFQSCYSTANAFSHSTSQASLGIQKCNFEVINTNLHRDNNSRSSICLFMSMENDMTFPRNTLRTRLRKLTGLSITSLRKTVRTTSDVSSKISKRTLKILPLWLRLAFQPFMMAYYWPLVVLGNVNVTEKEEETVEDAKVKSLMTGTISDVEPCVETVSKSIEVGCKEKVMSSEKLHQGEAAESEVVTPVPSGERWACSSQNCNLSGKWSLEIDDDFIQQYDNYLHDLGQPAIVRKVACSIVSFTMEEYHQIEAGRVLKIKGTNPRGVWSRDLISSGSSPESSIHESEERIESPVRTADGEIVMAEAWWENNGTVHKSWMRGGKKWGGGDFESTRYVDAEGNLICDTTFHPTDSQRPKSNIRWKFRKI